MYNVTISNPNYVHEYVDAPMQEVGRMGIPNPNNPTTIIVQVVGDNAEVSHGVLLIKSNNQVTAVYPPYSWSKAELVFEPEVVA